MKNKALTVNFLFSLACLFHACFAAAQAPKTIAITIDDLPFVGEYRNFHLNMMIDTMKAQQIPATGFIIAKEVRTDNWEILQKFRDAGFGLGNHTFSHANLNILDAKQYIREIKKADTILSPVMTEPKYFRYPYLAMSSGEKRNRILCYLEKQHYQVAPITVDSKDFVFNQRLLSVPEMDRRAYLNELKPFYLEFIWQQTLKAEEHFKYHHTPEQSQILLIHANLLNAYVLPDIIELYKQNGYEFVSLEDALNTSRDNFHCPMNLKKHSKPPIKKVTSQKADKKIETYLDWD